MKPCSHVTLTLVLLSLVVSACGSLETGVASNPESPTPSPDLQTDPTAPTPLPPVTASDTPGTDNAGVVMEEILEKAITDLTKRLGISKDQVQVIDAKAVTWPNASLGCPQPGMVYAEVLTPGYLILLRKRENIYMNITQVGGQRCFIVRIHIRLFRSRQMISDTSPFINYRLAKFCQPVVVISPVVQSRTDVLVCINCDDCQAKQLASIAM